MKLHSRALKPLMFAEQSKFESQVHISTLFHVRGKRISLSIYSWMKIHHEAWLAYYCKNITLNKTIMQVIERRFDIGSYCQMPHLTHIFFSLLGVKVSSHKVTDCICVVYIIERCQEGVRKVSRRCQAECLWRDICKK